MAETRSTSKWWLYPAIIAVVTVAAYSNSFSGVYVFDDLANVVENESIRSFSNAWNLEHSRGLNRRSVITWSLAVNYQISGLDVWSYHLFNLLIHLASALMLYDLVCRVLQQPKIPEPYRARSTIFAFAIAAIWAVHPIQTESVTYIIQRCESLMGFFYIALFYCIVRGAGSKRPAVWYVTGAIAASIGMGCKEVMLTAPVVSVLFDRAYLAESWSEVLKSRGWVYALVVPATLILFLSTSGTIFRRLERFAQTQQTSKSTDKPGPEVSKGSLNRLDFYSSNTEYLRTQPEVILHYMRLGVLPVGLCLDYFWPIQDNPLIYLTTCGIILSLIGLSLFYWYREPKLGFLGLAFFAILAPSSSIIVLNVAFEHRMYLPLIPFLALILIPAFELCDRARASDKTILITTSVVVGLFAILTFVRNQDYGSELTMAKDVLRKAPHNPRAHNDYGWALLKAGKHSEAKPHFHNALKIMPSFWTAHSNLARVAVIERDAQAALTHALLAHKFRPGEETHQATYVRIMNDVLGPSKALEKVQDFLKANPNSVLLRSEYANSLLMAGQFKDAEREYQQLAMLRPDDARPVYCLGLVNQSMGDLDGAERNYKAALKLDPNHARAHNNLGYVYYLVGETELAAKHLRAAVAADSKLAEPRLNLGKLYLDQREFRKAASQFESALRIDPHMAEAQQGLAKARRLNGG